MPAKLRVTRTIKFSYVTEYPNQYPDMSLSEAIDHEHQLETEYIIEILTCNEEDADMGVIVEVLSE